MISNEIPAEIPQAIIERDGKKEVVIKKINHGYNFPERQGLTYSEIDARVNKLDLVPIDYGGHNMMVDDQGYLHIIDVNRWFWPPHTDDYRKELNQLIRSYL